VGDKREEIYQKRSDYKRPATNLLLKVYLHASKSSKIVELSNRILFIY
jgi:hypothetical protein